MTAVEIKQKIRVHFWDQMVLIGFGLALEAMGVEHLKAQVGDRYVMEEMRKTGAVLGGEDSGHMIFLNHHTTGDGMLAA